MTIDELKRKLHEGEVSFKYRKADGTIRDARGTLCEKLMPKVEPTRKFKCTHIVWDTEDVEGEIPKLPSRETVAIPVAELEGMSKEEVDSYVCDKLTEKHSFLIKSFDIEEAAEKPAKKLPDGNIFYYDLDKAGFRSFKFENFIET